MHVGHQKEERDNHKIIRNFRGVIPNEDIFYRIPGQSINEMDL